MLHISRQCDRRSCFCVVSDVPRAPRGTPGVNPVGNAELDPNAGGGLSAIDIAQGQKSLGCGGGAVQSPRPGRSPAQPGAALTAIDGAVFSGSIDGQMCARESDSPDGVIEGLRDDDDSQFVVGVQWQAEWGPEKHALSIALYTAFGARNA